MWYSVKDYYKLQIVLGKETVWPMEKKCPGFLRGGLKAPAKVLSYI
jgi:hypothetical protein